MSDGRRSHTRMHLHLAPLLCPGRQADPDPVIAPYRPGPKDSGSLSALVKYRGLIVRAFGHPAFWRPCALGEERYGRAAERSYRRDLRVWPAGCSVASFT